MSANFVPLPPSLFDAPSRNSQAARTIFVPDGDEPAFDDSPSSLLCSPDGGFSNPSARNQGPATVSEALGAAIGGTWRRCGTRWAAGSLLLAVTAAVVLARGRSREDPTVLMQAGIGPGAKLTGLWADQWGKQFPCAIMTCPLEVDPKLPLLRRSKDSLEKFLEPHGFDVDDPNVTNQFFGRSNTCQARMLTWGENTVCRHNLVDNTEAGHMYEGTRLSVKVLQLPLEQCKTLCKRSHICTGIEHEAHSNRCELWRLPVCHHKTPRLETGGNFTCYVKMDCCY